MAAPRDTFGCRGTRSLAASFPMRTTCATTTSPDRSFTDPPVSIPRFIFFNFLTIFQIYCFFGNVCAIIARIMNMIQTLEQEEVARLARDVPPFAAGDRVAVRTYVIDGSARRVQTFEGMVIARRRRGINASFTIRRTSSGESMERTFQLYSPLIESIRVIRHGDVRRAKLYYLRQRSGKSARIKEKLGDKKQTKPA